MSDSIKNQNRSTLEWAEYYLSRGFSVIPLLPRDKRPAIFWKEYQTRKPTKDELTEWFSKGNNNIGIVTGKISGIVVVDLDSEDALDFADQNGFADTPTVITSKGLHLYYQYPDDKEVVRNFQRRDDLPGIDLRGDHGYVVAPPSVHESGVHYEWAKDHGLEDLPLSTKFPEMILKKEGEKAQPKERLSRIPEGKRNDNLFTTTCNLQKAGITLDDCKDYALWFNQRRNNPPLPDAEVERTVKGAYERYQGQKSVRQFSDTIYSHQTEKLNLDTFDYATVLKKGMELKDLEIKVEWLIDSILPKQSITLLHGRGGIGKTWLSMMIGDMVSRGRNFFGRKVEQVPVYYLDFENSLPVLVERIRLIKADKIQFWHNTEDPSPPKIDSNDWVVYREKLPPGLLIVDTLRAFQSHDENDSRQMASVMSKLKEIRDKGFTILLLHHTPKGNERTYKGSTAIFDLCDHVLSFHSIKSPDTTEEDDKFGKYRWFGTKDKTRYIPFSMSLMFDQEKIFIEVQNQDFVDSEKIRLEIARLILENEKFPNQSEVIDTVKTGTGLSENRIKDLLKQGDGKYWDTEKGEKNKKLYQAAFRFADTIYAQTEELKLDDQTVKLIRDFEMFIGRRNHKPGPMELKYPKYKDSYKCHIDSYLSIYIEDYYDICRRCYPGEFKPI